MSDLLNKAQALQAEIDRFTLREKAFEALDKDMSEREEKIRLQNIAQTKSADDLIAYQKQTRELEARVNERASEITIKEKALATVEKQLTERLAAIIQREKEVFSREQKLAAEKAEFGKVSADVERQKILNKKEIEIDVLRKSKLTIKEQQIESELARLRGMGV